MIAARAGLAGLLGVAALAWVCDAQLGFAAVAVGGIGMAHGAGDLAAVPHGRRSAFLLAYAAVAGLTLTWWIAAPALALPLFLLASAAHFAAEDGRADAPVAAVGRGLLTVGGPALLHEATLAALLAPVAGDAAAPCARVLWAAGLAGLAVTATDVAKRRDGPLAIGMAALVLPPPLIGFSLGFLLMHALPQTRARALALGCAGVPAYLRRVAPVLAAALVTLGVIAAAFLPRDGSGMTAFFAALAALAVPHLVVTPWFERRTASRLTLLAATAPSWSRR